MVGLVHRRGFKAIVWTANSRIAINNAIRSGADGIISDRVELLKELIEKKTKQK
jgi:glycerophosphoryl diester phosphodiesterase